MEPLLTAQQVATWLNMSLVWVYKATEKGLLPFHRVGEAIRFDPEEIRAYLNARKDLKRTYPMPHNSNRRTGRHDLLHGQQEAQKSD